jgi:hypothetical protein
MNLAINNLIKLILGILVFVAIIIAFYFFFKDQVVSLFENIGFSKPEEIFLGLLK